MLPRTLVPEQWRRRWPSKTVVVSKATAVLVNEKRTDSERVLVAVVLPLLDTVLDTVVVTEVLCDVVRVEVRVLESDVVGVDVADVLADVVCVDA